MRFGPALRRPRATPAALLLLVEQRAVASVRGHPGLGPDRHAVSVFAFQHLACALICLRFPHQTEPG